MKKREPRIEIRQREDGKWDWYCIGGNGSATLSSHPQGYNTHRDAARAMRRNAKQLARALQLGRVFKGRVTFK